MIANVHVSWLDPQKVRKIVVVGSRRMVVYDDLAESKIAIYDKGIDRKAILGENMDFDNPRPLQFNYRSRDIVLPQIQFKEPLRAEVEHFRDCIRGNEQPSPISRMPAASSRFSSGRGPFAPMAMMDHE